MIYCKSTFRIITFSLNLGIYFLVLLVGTSCNNSEEEPRVAIKGTCLSDDGSPVAGMQIYFYDTDSHAYLRDQTRQTDINGNFTGNIPIRYEAIQVHGTSYDTIYHWSQYIWAMETDPGKIQKTLIPRRSEIVFNFARKETSAPKTNYEISVQYKFLIGGSPSYPSDLYGSQSLLFDTDTTMTELKMPVPRGQNVNLTIRKWREGVASVYLVDTMFIVTNRKIPMKVEL